jgi:inactivated superfamily I helicase
VDFREFRRWLARRLETAAFRDSSIDSPVVFASLEATRLRSFDATLIAGADEKRLPGGSTGGMFFNQRARRDLGLPGTEAHVREVQELLIGLLGNAGHVAAQPGRRAQSHLAAVRTAARAARAGVGGPARRCRGGAAARAAAVAR